MMINLISFFIMYIRCVLCVSLLTLHRIHNAMPPINCWISLEIGWYSLCSNSLQNVFVVETNPTRRWVVIVAYIVSPATNYRMRRKAPIIPIGSFCWNCHISLWLKTKRLDDRMRRCSSQVGSRYGMGMQPTDYSLVCLAWCPFHHLPR